MKNWIPFPRIEGRASRQARAGIIVPPSSTARIPVKTTSGKPAGRRLASSRRADSSARIVNERAFRLSSSCESRVAPMIVEARVGIARFRVGAELGHDHDAIPLSRLPDELAEELLALAPLVSIGGVDEVAARFETSVEGLSRGSPVRTPSRHVSERHGAETKRGYAKPASSEQAVRGEGLDRGIRSGRRRQG